MEGYSTELGTWEEAVLKLISGRGKEGNKELLSTYYILDTPLHTLCICIHWFTQQIFMKYL